MNLYDHRPLHPYTHNLQALLVDDCEDMLDVYTLLLERIGMKPALATTDPFEAIELAQKHSPDLLISDYTMPLMDGFEMLKIMRMNKNLQNMAALLCTTYPESRIIREFEASSYDAMILMPTPLDTYVEAISSILAIPLPPLRIE